MKNEKMTCKQFKQILEKADFPSNIYGYDDILNILSLALRYQATAERQSCPYSADADERSARIIYDELAKLGYYGNY